MAKRFPTTFTEDTFLSGDVAVVKDQWTQIGEYSVKAQEAVAFGSGDFRTQSDATGRIYAVFKNGATTPAKVTGWLRLAIYDNNDMPRAIIKEYRTEQLDTVANDVTKQAPFARDSRFATEDRKLKLFFKPDNGDTIVKANSDILMSMTRELD